MDNENVIPGPAVLIISATTIGHTQAGGRIVATHESDEVTTHESDPVPVDIRQRPMRRRMEVGLCEITVANLNLLCGDVTTSGSSIQWVGAQTRGTAPTIASAKLQNTRPNGSTTVATLYQCKALVPEFNFSGMRGEKAILNVVLEGLYLDSGTLMKISGVGS